MTAVHEAGKVSLQNGKKLPFVRAVSLIAKIVPILGAQSHEGEVAA